MVRQEGANVRCRRFQGTYLVLTQEEVNGCPTTEGKVCPLSTTHNLRRALVYAGDVGRSLKWSFPAG